MTIPQYLITRLDQMTQAVNTFANLDTDTQGGSAGAVRVPQNVRRIKRMLVSIGASADTGTDTGGVLSLRLTGNGLKDGQQEVVVGSVTNLAIGTAATGIFEVAKPLELVVDIEVIPGNDVTIAAAISGVDPGTIEIGVTLVLE